MNNTTITTESYNYEFALSIIDNINKSAEKLGLTDRASIIKMTEHKDDITLEIEYPELTLDGDIKVHAIVENIGSDYNLVTSFDDFADPSLLKADLSQCDHCHTNRQRVKSYSLTHDGVIKLVGSTCLSAYVGQKNYLHLLEYERFTSSFEKELSLLERQPRINIYPMEQVVCAVVPNVSMDKDETFICSLKTLDNAPSGKKPAKAGNKLVKEVLKGMKKLKKNLLKGIEMNEFETKIAVMALSGVPTKSRHMSSFIGMTRFLIIKAGKTKVEDRFKGLPDSKFVHSVKDAVFFNCLITKSFLAFDSGFGYYDKGEYKFSLYLRDLTTGNVFYTKLSEKKCVDLGIGTWERTSPEEGDKEYVELTKESINLVGTISAHFTNKREQEVTKINRVRFAPTAKASLKKIKAQ